MLAALLPTDTTSRLQWLTLLVFAGVEATVLTSLYSTLPGAVRQASDEAAWLLILFVLLALTLLRRAAPLIPIVGTSPPTLRVVYLVAYVPLFFICMALLRTDYSGVMLAALFALMLWWRGISLGQNQLHPQEARNQFWWGLGLVSVLLAFDFKLARVGLLIAFALLGLMALMLSQLYAVAQHNDISPRALTRPAWRKALGLVLLAAFGLIGLDAALLNSEVAAWLVRGVVVLFFMPIGFAVGLILKFLQWLIPASLFEGLGSLLQQFFQQLNAIQRSPPPPSDPIEAITEKTVQVVDPQMVVLGMVLAVVVVLLLLLAGGMGLRRVTKRRREAEAMPIADIAADEDDGSAVEDGIPNLLRQTFSRWFAAATIRLIYARMAREAARRGFERTPAQTTQEFLPALQQAFPTAEADVRLISDAYEAAHYGQVPDTAEQLTTIREAWERVRRIPPTPPPSLTGESLISAKTHP